MEKLQIYEEFKKDFIKNIYRVKDNFSEYVFLCIGTNKVVGDSFGPYVGQFLIKEIKNRSNIHVVGNIHKNVSYLNVEYNIKQIYKRFENPCIIAIDSALSRQQDVGKILVTNSKTKLGECVGKQQHEVGDISIKGVVAKNYTLPYRNFIILKTRPKRFVINLARATAQGICEALYIKY